MQHATCRDLYIAALAFFACCKRLLNEKRHQLAEVDVIWLSQSGKSEMITRANGGAQVPQIFIGDTHVGGCDDLYALERCGQAGRVVVKLNAQAA